MSVKFAALILFIRAFVQSDYAAQAVVVALSGSLRDNNDYSVMDNRQSKSDVARSSLFRLDRVINRAALRDKRFLWPKATVPYAISPDYRRHERRLIARAMLEFHKHTCVRFEPRANETNYIYIEHTGDGCYSHVGMVGGRQNVSLDSPGCMDQATVAHELMHALGFFHEQARYDRDRHVNVDLTNVEQKNHVNFVKHSREHIQHLGVGYDYGSIMHYKSTNLANKGHAITRKDGSTEFSNDRGMTKKDILKVNRLYRCDASDQCWDDDVIGCRYLLAKHGRNYCSTNQTAMARDCQKSCGLCTAKTERRGDACRDLNGEMCAYVARSSKMCASSERWRKFCAKSCQVCK